ncbi:hypothetical protein ROLI_011380 [Roseobacter fucihabitans]|uniref:Glycerophosphoryl diester phosphodiesterase membrane domain-containing protein n=1 Tax=Roseobacter fucihabitans TaxID=1537242 RepID=A0ABZ2BRG8_9RHOB|nr:hypothetical protein [Roseobacter litoralis]MBC6964334.1 hypothetical protein [Roseobacter litoralis]
MKTDIAILQRSFRLMFADPLKTLKVTSPGLAFLIGAGLLFDAQPMITAAEQRVALDPGPAIVQAIIGGVGVLLIAVYWHRYALLEGDARDQIMRPGVGVLAQYLGKLIVVFLVLLIAAIPAILLIFGTTLILSGGSATLVIVVGVGIGILFSWIAMRISLTLPAAALGTRLAIVDSLQATKPLSGAILRVAVILAVMNTMLAGVITSLAAASLAAAVVGQLVLSYFQIIVSISVLSTLYGHLVQHRPLT